MPTWTMVEGHARDEHGNWQRHLLRDGKHIKTGTYTENFDYVLATAADEDWYAEAGSTNYASEPVATLKARHEDLQRQIADEITLEEYYRRWPPPPAWMNE